MKIILLICSIPSSFMCSHLFNEKHVTLILCKGAILVFHLHGNDWTSFLELEKHKQAFFFLIKKINRLCFSWYVSSLTCNGTSFGISLSKKVLTAWMNPGCVVRSLMLLSWRSQLQRHRKHAQLTLNNRATVSLKYWTKLETLSKPLL